MKVVVLNSLQNHGKLNSNFHRNIFKTKLNRFFDWSLHVVPSIHPIQSLYSFHYATKIIPQSHFHTRQSPLSLFNGSHLCQVKLLRTQKVKFSNIIFQDLKKYSTNNKKEENFDSPNIKEKDLNQNTQNFTSVRTTKSRNFRILIILIVGLLSSPFLFLYAISPREGSIPLGTDNVKENLFTGFQETKVIYYGRTISDLIFALTNFAFCNTISEKICNLSFQYFDQFWTLPFRWFIKKFFFQFFSGGETLEQAKLRSNELRRKGVGTIWSPFVLDATSDQVNQVYLEQLTHIIKNSENLDVQFIPIRFSGLISPKFLEGLSLEANKDEFIANSKETQQLIDGLKKLCTEAESQKVSILFEAETSERQPAIDFLVLYLSRIFNKGKKLPIVYNTYQTYFRDGFLKFNSHLQLAKNEGFTLGAQLVRGAYLLDEMQAAKTNLNLDKRLLQEKMFTDSMFHKSFCLGLLKLSEGQPLGLMISTHNLESILIFIQFMREHRISHQTNAISFCQYQGMSDNLSIGLSYMSFRAYKLIQFGDLKSSLPFLKRQIQENKSIYSATQFERQVIWTELLKRLKN